MTRATSKTGARRANPISTAWQQLQPRWQALAPRERSLVQITAVVVVLALLWWVLIAPALSTLQKAPARHAQLDAQLQQMQTLRAEAIALQAATRTQPEDALRALRSATEKNLGDKTALQVAGDRATVVLQATPASALAQWLSQARSNAHAGAVQAELNKNPAATWDGNVVMAWPAP